jgi:hypothetical protein
MSGGADKATGRLALGILLGCGLVLGTAWPAFAQRGTSAREPHGFYVSATVFGDIERFSQDSTDLMNGQTGGLGIGIGTFVTPRWSLEFEAAMPRFIDQGLRVQTFQPLSGGINYVQEARTQTRHRTDTGTVLLGFHPSRRGRVRMAYCAGVVFVRLRLETMQDVTVSEVTGIRTGHSSLARTDLILAPVFQLEASVRLTRRLALVPHFRASAFDVDTFYGGVVGSLTGPGVFLFRPGTSLRISY